TFKSIDPNSDNAADICTTGALNLFGVAPQVTTRNAPTTVNGVAFFRQMFWDGRGNDNFNGAGPFGQTANNTAAQKTSAAFSAVGPWLAVKGQFSRAFGQAVQAYESTLIPDQTPLDRLLAGNSKAMTDSQKKGLSVFRGKGGCTKCHAGPELTDASVTFANIFGLINEDGGDQGFHNLGVRPTIEDLGRAGTGGANVAPFS